MQMNQTRPWEWEPPAFLNRVMALLLRITVLHRIISGGILLLTYTGRKSGKRYSLPVGYWQEGKTVTLLTKRFHSWWHNFEQAAPVTVRIQGKNFEGEAHVLTEETIIVPLIAHLVEGRERQAQIWQIRLGDDHKPNMDDVRATARKVVVIQIALWLS